MNSADLFTVEESRPSAVFIVIDKMKELLIEQKLKPGEMIPSESALAESLKVGRGSVREALKILSAYGVIEIRRGKGTYVSTASNRRLFDPFLFQILVQKRDYTILTQVRRILEEGIVKLVIQSANEEDLQQLQSAADGFLAELSQQNPSPEHAKQLDIQYHKLLGKLSHNPIIENIYDFIIVLFASTINPIHEGVYEVHRDLQEAIMAKDEDKALSLIARHNEIWIQAHDNAQADSLE
jgi:GntR family transcriptional repressor for pyruvate dehydrogenase complex